MAFLRAHWRDLIMVNWSISPEHLEPLVPKGCELDFFEGQTYISLVAFRFEKTFVLGLPIPGYRNFEEVNLRFYVKHTPKEGECRRGVVFIQELVPKRLIAFVARTLYQEPYRTITMSHRNDQQETGNRTLSYKWGDHWISGNVGPSANKLASGSLEQFIAEHYWGYTKTSRGTREYRVQHPSWKWRAYDDCQYSIDFGDLYGKKWAFLSQEQPTRIFVAEGSEVSVDPWGWISGRREAEL